MPNLEATGDGTRVPFASNLLISQSRVRYQDSTIITASNMEDSFLGEVLPSEENITFGSFHNESLLPTRKADPPRTPHGRMMQPFGCPREIFLSFTSLARTWKK